METLAQRLEKMRAGKTEEVKSGGIRSAGSLGSTPINPEYIQLKKWVRERLIESYNTRQLQENVSEEDKQQIFRTIHGLIEEEGAVMSISEEDKITSEIYDDVMGLGPIEPLLRDPSVSEIMVVQANQIYIERQGRLQQVNVYFEDNEHVMRIIDRIVSQVGRRCDEANPMVDARLKDGSRVNAVIPPIALKGPCLTIRKFSTTPLWAKDLIAKGSMSGDMAEFLEACVRGKCNIVVSGGTGSGKTTLLNVLSSFIDERERIVTIEDAAELQLMQNHVVTMESRPANVEGKGRVSIRDMVVNALRMRPDRIIVGEVRSTEALDMLQAMNTGHDGSMTTVHANSARDVLSRLETMVMMCGTELPSKAIREQISSALQLIVQQSRLRDGSRKITSITEVLNLEGETIVLQDIFTYQQEGIDPSGRIRGRFMPQEIVPRIAERLEEQGVPYKESWFSRS